MAANFEDLKKNHKKNRFSSESKNSSGERLCLIRRFGWKNNKNPLLALIPKKKSKKNNFAGGVVSGLENSFAAN